MSNEQDSAVRAANKAVATRMMENFGRNMDGWYDDLHEDCVMEFPFGASVGMPERVEGKEGCSAVFGLVCQLVQVQFFDIVVHDMADPNNFVVEYQGHGDPEPGAYDQKYICMQSYKDGKLIKFKEYWNSKIVFDLFGDLSALGS